MKICNDCGKEFKGNIRIGRCDSCYIKKYKLQNVGICKICLCENYILKVKKICQKCNNKLHYKKYRTQILARASKYIKEKVRKKKGLPLNHPKLIAERGSGHLCKTTGYRYITKMGHPNSWSSKGIRKDGKKHKYEGRMLEHVFVMSEYLKRPLLKGESVHHKNGIRHDNRIENLEIWYRGQPAGQRLQDKIKWAKEFLELYGYIVNEPTA